jgi:hypothetical protein
LHSPVRENNLNIIWSIRTRVDKGYSREVLEELYQYGLRELWIGLETTSARILKLMNKTNYPEEYAEVAAKILKYCNEIGIGIHYCTILGFPSETDEEREELVKFFKKNKPSLSRMPFFMTFNTYGLIYNSKIYNKPEEFGITEICNDVDRFNMESIPYKTKWGDETSSQQNRDKIDAYFNRILDTVVQDKLLPLAWFTISDSPYELLLKKYYSSNGKSNPFQKKPSYIESLFVKLYMLLSEMPYTANYCKNFVQKVFLGIK